MVEFAIGLPLLLVMLIGIIEIGRAVLAFTMVGNLAREGARYAVMTTVAAAPSSMPHNPPDTDNTKPAWYQFCNLGHNGASPPPYDATDSRCQGWPNIVSSIVDKSPSLDPDELKIFVSYDSPTSSLDGYNRSIPITVRTEYEHTILFATFLGLPESATKVTITSASTMITQ